MSSGSGINSVFPPRSSFFPARSREAAVICDFTPDLLLWDLGSAATPSAHIAAAGCGEGEMGNKQGCHLARSGRCSLPPLPDRSAALGVGTKGQGHGASYRKQSPPCVNSNMSYSRSSCDRKHWTHPCTAAPPL